MKSKILSLLLIFPLLFSLLTPIHAGAIDNFEVVTPGEGCPAGEVNTAIGCISTSVDTASGNSFFVSILRIAIGLGGGLALLLMLYGVFIVTTSAGIPDKLKEGKEVITSAISGLLFIILSVFLLRLIGVSILGIPGLL